VNGNITGIDTTVTVGRLKSSKFDQDMASAVAASDLGARHAVLFTPDSGNLAGNTYLIVDQNGVAGYQAGADLVMRLDTPTNLGNLDTADFI
jgi:hypothetical protein